MTPDKRSAGFSLVEVMVVGVVVGTLTMFIVQALADLSRTQAFTRGQTRIAETADRVMRGVARDLSFAVRVFHDSDEADAYLATLDYPVAAVVPDARLATLTDDGLFEPDLEGTLETGNLLAFARYQMPATVTVTVAGSGGGEEPLREEMMVVEGGGGGGSTRDYRIDTMNFIVYYLTMTSGGDLDLERWGSQPVARFQDVMTVEFGARTEALTQLYTAGVRYVWDPALDREDGLYQISSIGAMVPMSETAKIPVDEEQVQKAIVSSRQMRVARNGKVGKVRVPRYAVPGATGFPGGFEIKIDGPTSGKLVLLRLVLRMGPGDSRDNFAELLRYVSCRDG